MPPADAVASRDPSGLNDHPGDCRLMHEAGGDGRPGPGVPDPRSAVEAGSRKQTAIAGERDVDDTTPVRHDGCYRLAGRCVPHPSRAVAAGCGESTAGGIKRGMIGSAGELHGHGRTSDGRHIPEPGGRVGTDGQHARSVRCEPGALENAAVIERWTTAVLRWRHPRSGPCRRTQPWRHDLRPG